MTNTNPNTKFHVAILGGVDYKPEQQTPQRFVSVSPIGGANVDFSGIDQDVTVVKVSLVGGVRLTVPADVNVETIGFGVPGLLGRRRFRGTGGPDAPTVRVHRYGIFGGVRIVRNG
ncbi:hypothetical protein NE235_11180 [Actinoallomurus spadix]|uniref:Cell wall-active antibiotics response LiaF-like C-terminal domain-containing protein n=1 Tax=Actinoallomurus spadix TaxID=79912 RepID=A0ABP3GLC9_9ACTN|nr:hypothetical protein [Actinoallomurus spadix]MCO5986664.1 hypothetical protein [Actinoallomurus spadix]